MAGLLNRAPAAPDPGREQPAGARLPYARHLDDATIETRDGRLLQVIHLKGLPFETADSEDLNYRKQVRETMLRGIASSRFALYHHVVRREVRPELTGEFRDPFSRALDAAWRTRLERRRLYVNELFLTLVRRPTPGRVGLLQGALAGGRRRVDRAEQAAAHARELGALNTARDGLLAALEPYGARLLTVYDGPQGRVLNRSSSSACSTTARRGRCACRTPTSVSTCPTGGSASAPTRWSSVRPAACRRASRRWCR